MASSYTFPDHIKGDTFDGLTFTMIVNDSPLNLTGAIIRMQLRPTLTSPTIAKTFTTTDDSIRITNPTGGIFEIPPQIVDIPATEYQYDIEFRFLNGEVKTYIKGTWTIIQDVTHV